MIRPIAFATLTTGLLAAAAPAQAESRATYTTLVLEAFAAKVECPGTDLVYQDLVQKANEMHLPDGTTEMFCLYGTRSAASWHSAGYFF